MHKTEPITVETTRKQEAPQVKICGLTSVQEAVACAALGADAIGFVFYAKSPRYVTIPKAREIAMALPPCVCRVGVFVDETFDAIMKTARNIPLDTVQLHGAEPPALVEKLGGHGLKVVKALFSDRHPRFTQAHQYAEAAFLVECGAGPLPGGNARSWNFSLLKDFAIKFPLVLAGGLTIHNVTTAIRQSRPDAVDISSGVERRPGKKSLSKVKQFITITRNTRIAQPKRRIFYGTEGDFHLSKR